MTEIFDKDLGGNIGKDIVLKYGENTQEVTLVAVRETMVSFKLKTNNEWNGIEPWYKRPINGLKIFINE